MINNNKSASPQLLLLLITGLLKRTKLNLTVLVVKKFTLSVVDHGFKTLSVQKTMKLVFAVSLLIMQHLGIKANTFWFRIRICARMEQPVYPWTVVSVIWYYKMFRP